MKDKKLVDIDFKLEWKSPFAEHTDIFQVYEVDLDGDKLPQGFAEKIALLSLGESYTQTFPAKELLGESYSSDKVINFNSELFDSHFKDQYSPPILYRFYPSAIAWQGLGTDVEDNAPFRLISISDDTIAADRNHPLAKYYLTLTASKIKEVEAPENNQRRRRHIGKLICFRGPGMQAPFEYGDPVFFKQYPFQLNVLNQQTAVSQLDQTTTQEIKKLHSQLLSKHSKVLDLLSGADSYLSESYETGMLTGIGTDEVALESNRRLDTYQLQDLNKSGQLPFEDNSFDDAICSMQIDSLNDPLLIMQEIARVVVSGGKFIITFSNKPTTPQPISLWGQLHPFERIQLVLEYFRQSDLFIDINTFSKRGVIKRFMQNNSVKKRASDAVFAVYATVK